MGRLLVDPALGLALSGRLITVSDNNRTTNWKVVCLELPE